MQLSQFQFNPTDAYIAIISRETGWTYKIEIHSVKSCSSVGDLQESIRKLLTTGTGRVTLHGLIIGEVMESGDLRELLGPDLQHRLL